MDSHLLNPKWIYQPSEIPGAPLDYDFVSSEDIPADAVGFVYRITRVWDRKFYIGKKLLKFKKRLKRKGKRDKIQFVESDWKTYWGSCRELQEDIAKQGTQAFQREILQFCSSKHELAYIELITQLEAGIMKPQTNTYNGIINVRLRRPRGNIK